MWKSKFNGLCAISLWKANKGCTFLVQVAVHQAEPWGLWAKDLFVKINALRLIKSPYKKDQFIQQICVGSTKLQTYLRLWIQQWTRQGPALVHLLVRKSENQEPTNAPLSMPSSQRSLGTCLQLNKLGLLIFIARQNTHHREPWSISVRGC